MTTLTNTLTFYSELHLSYWWAWANMDIMKLLHNLRELIIFSHGFKCLRFPTQGKYNSKLQNWVFIEIKKMSHKSVFTNIKIPNSPGHVALGTDIGWCLSGISSCVIIWAARHWWKRRLRLRALYSDKYCRGQCEKIIKIYHHVWLTFGTTAVVSNIKLSYTFTMDSPCNNVNYRQKCNEDTFTY